MDPTRRSLERECTALPPWSRRPRRRAEIETRSHDASCVSPLLDDLVRGMLAAQTPVGAIGVR
ncbi:MAG: hypothetical protein ACK54X_05180 [Burkholderiales bacterium]